MYCMRFVAGSKWAPGKCPTQAEPSCGVFKRVKRSYWGYRSGRQSLIVCVFCCFASFLTSCSKSETAEASAPAKGGAPGGGGGGGRGPRGDAPVSVLIATATTRDVPIQAEVIGNVEASS